MADLDKLAMAMPQTTKEVSDDGRPSYLVHGKMYCFHRGRRPDAIDPETGERMSDVLMFRVADEGVKELLLSDGRGVYFTTPHFNGYPAILMRIPGPEEARPPGAGRPGRRVVADPRPEAGGEGLAGRALRAGGLTGQARSPHPARLPDASSDTPGKRSPPSVVR